jgi:hypothetical protein
MPPVQPELPPLLRSDSKPRPLITRVALFIGAAVFFALGIVGWLVPVVTGVPFYIVAFAMLGASSRRAARVLNRAERRLPYRWRVGLRNLLARAREHARKHARKRARKRAQKRGRSRSQSSPRERSPAMTSESTVSKGSGDQPSSERAFSEPKRK